MQDLNVIARQNAAAVERDIPRQLAAGKIVVAEFTGLHFVGYETFSGDNAKKEAEAKLARLNSSGSSTHGRIFWPEGVTA